ncbi:MAG: nicotinate-nucleotide--dimethylbenzimidazole phosphoribosyltransferase [Blastocatellia bacterium]|nr:nicotinate-nucleotide--dimethylbenzimidazole phosphoribosyltransferase [Blastocatellia bacterium]
MEEIIDRIEPIDQTYVENARNRQQKLTKPAGSLGRLEEVANSITGITRNNRPSLKKKRIYIVAADHGVADEGVSAYPKQVTFQMVLNFLQGGAAINVLGRHGSIDLRVVDAGVAHPLPQHEILIDRKIAPGSRNFTQVAAMTYQQAEQSIAIGIELVQQAKIEGIELLGVGEMGIGNSTSASAITSILTSKDPSEVTGSGTGITNDQLQHKISLIRKAIMTNKPNPKDSIDILHKIGGLEIGVITGMALGAAAEKIPFLCDGFISTSAVALAVALSTKVRDYIFISHYSTEPGQRALVEYLNIDPLLDLKMRLGEATGVAVAMHLVEASTKLLNEMATFDQAGVSEKI